MFGIEFDLGNLRKKKWQFVNAWFRTHLSQEITEGPRVVKIAPERLYEGAPRKVAAKFSPSFKLGDYGGSLGELGFEMTGQIAPVMIGFLGEAQRRPYWELRRGPKPIEGIYNFWAIVESLEPQLEVRVLAEADLQIYKFGFPVGPSSHSWDDIKELIIPPPEAQ